MPTIISEKPSTVASIGLGGGVSCKTKQKSEEERRKRRRDVGFRTVQSVEIQWSENSFGTSERRLLHDKSAPLRANFVPSNGIPANPSPYP